jgi:hypothetical protein
LPRRGTRVIEVPENLEQFENRETRSRFLAYVPPGSIKRGEALAARIRQDRSLRHLPRRRPEAPTISGGCNTSADKRREDRKVLP